MERFPNAKIILSHGGGFIPYAAERIARTCSADGVGATGIVDAYVEAGYSTCVIPKASVQARVAFVLDHLAKMW